MAASILRIESLVLVVLVGVSACSLLAPSDHDLSSEWGNGGVAASSGGRGLAAGGSRAGNSGGSEALSYGGHGSGGVDGAGSGSVDDLEGGSTSQAGAGNDTEGGASAMARGGAVSAGGASSAGFTSSGGTIANGGAVSAGGGALSANGGTITNGGSVANGGAPSANGGTVSTSGGKVGAGGASSGGRVSGAGGAVSHCSPNPCVHGSCSETGTSYKCTCPAGWGGTTCAVGSCSNMSCPSSAPCTVPASNVAAVCYPSACAGKVGLCMAENADGSGAAIIIEGRNADFDPLSGANWRNRAKYFGYLDNAHGGYVCVFPQQNEGGTPLVIPLNSVRTKTAGFGQSNSWPNPPTCEYP